VPFLKYSFKYSKKEGKLIYQLVNIKYMHPSPITTNFPTNTIHKYILFLSSVLLTFSLFFETKVVDNAFVQKGAFTFVIIGLIWWIIYKIIDDQVNIYINNKRHSEKEIKETCIFWYWSWKAIIVTGLIIGLKILF
jgi:hypothetical protein